MEGERGRVRTHGEEDVRRLTGRRCCRLSYRLQGGRRKNERMQKGSLLPFLTLILKGEGEEEGEEKNSTVKLLFLW